LIFGHFASLADWERLQFTGLDERLYIPDIDIPVVSNFRLRIVLRKSGKVWSI